MIAISVYNRRLRLGIVGASVVTGLAVSACLALCEKETSRAPASGAGAPHDDLESPSASATASGMPTATKQSALGRYRLDEPNLEDKLPGRLKEISGVTALSATQVACVQDEAGVIYVYDLATRSITREIEFGPPGDYEGIAHAQGSLFVLRSDGLLYQVDDYAGQPRVSSHRLELASYDNEGLCFDQQHRRLLVAPKSALDRKDTSSDARPIFGFDLATRRLLEKPVIVLSVDAIVEFASARKLSVPKSFRKKKARQEAFLPASIALHPITAERFVFSAVDRTLAVFDERGQVTGYTRLGKKPFRQPEGATFLPNGDLVITSEGRGKKARLLHFRMNATP